MSNEPVVPPENEVTIPPVETPPEPPEAPPVPPVPETPPVATPSQEQVRQTVKEQTGLNDAAIDLIVNTVAPVGERVAWMDIKTAKEGTSMPINTEIEKEMKDELKNYPADQRANPILLEKVYRMAVGSLSLKTPKAPATPNPIIGRRIVTNHPSPAGAGTTGDESGSKKTELSQDEKTICQKMGIKEADYMKHKGSTAIPVAGAA